MALPASAVGEGSIAVQMVHRYFAEIGHEPVGHTIDVTDAGRLAPVGRT